MRKLLVSVLAIIITVCALADNVQKGYVKTRGRLSSSGAVIPGKRLAGATVLLRQGSAVVSDGSGNFSLRLPAARFYLKNVKKSGYVVSDPDMLSRQYACSSNPLVLVLDEPNAMLDDKLASERKQRRLLQRRLQQKEDEIESLREQNRITDDQYRQQLQKLYAGAESNERLISEMAERYSRLDFDQLDDFQRRMAAFIQDGELARADSLLRTKGSMDDREAEINRLREANSKERQELAERQENLNKSQQAEEAIVADFAADCYSHYELCKLKFDNDSAAYWLERRARLAPDNALYQTDTGVFLGDYLAKYQEALVYLNRAIEIARDPMQKALIYQAAGRMEANRGNNDVAAGNYYNAIDCWYTIYNGSPYIVQIQDNLSDKYGKLFEIACSATEALNSEIINDYDISQKIYTCYDDVANLFFALFNDMEHGEQILFHRMLVEPKDPLLPESLKKYTKSPYGDIYDENGNDAAVQYDLEYIEYLDDRQPPEYISKKVETLIDLGIHREVYEGAGNGIGEFTSALQILEQNLGKHHPETLDCKRRIALSKLESLRYDDAVKYINDSIMPSALIIYNAKSRYMKDIYYLLGEAYMGLENYSEALVCYSNALEALKTEKDLDGTEEAALLMKKGLCCKKLNRPIEAKKYLNSSKSTFETIEDAFDYSDIVSEIEQALMDLQ